MSRLSAPALRFSGQSSPSRVELDHHWTAVDGLWMHARVGLATAPPAAPVIVLLHGLVVSSRYLVPTARRLAADYRVYAPDLPGFGHSQAPPTVLDMPTLADALAAWLRTNNLAAVTLVANSMGCQVAAHCASRHPALVARLVLVGPSFDCYARTTGQQIWRLVRDGLREPPAGLLIVLRDLFDAGIGRSWLTFRHALADHLEEQLGQIQQPTLVVRGSRDPITSPAWAATVAARLPRGRLIGLPGAAHVPHFSHPRRFVRLLRAFISHGDRTTGRSADRLANTQRSQLGG